MLEPGVGVAEADRFEAPARLPREPPHADVAPFEREEDLDGRRVALHEDPARGRRARRGVAASDRA